MFIGPSPVHGFGFCNTADPPSPPHTTKCGPNTTFCPVEVDCPVAAGGAPSLNGCYGVVGVSDNIPALRPGVVDSTGLRLDCYWSRPRLTADRTAYAYVCRPLP